MRAMVLIFSLSLVLMGCDSGCFATVPSEPEVTQDAAPDTAPATDAVVVEADATPEADAKPGATPEVAPVAE